MAKKVATISNITLKPASEGGFILSWCEKTEKPAAGKGTYDNCSYEYPDQAFSSAEKDKAIAKMIELAGMMHDSEEADEGETVETY